LRLPPRVFWALSLPEWRAIAAPPAKPTLSRRAFTQLMQRYPDEPHAE
jgi:hypothetical protein